MINQSRNFCIIFGKRGTNLLRILTHIDAYTIILYMKLSNLVKILIIAAAVSCSGKPQTIDVIPQPQQVQKGLGSFDMRGASVNAEAVSDAMAAAYIATFVHTLEEKVPAKDNGGSIVFCDDPELGAEEYTLDVNRKGISISASTSAGYVYAIQTLKQLMPAEIWGGEKDPKADWKIKAVSVRDYPRFGYRGVLLDCARHFFSIEEVYRFIDILVAHKMNRLHWHLTDDQGWRIEIKKYPLLTEVGAWRNGTMVGRDWNSDDHIRYGGYYTQEQLKAVVAYAAERGMTIIPEIDLPGHMQAVLTAYPQLGCCGGPYEVRKIWGVSDDVLCAGNEQTYRLLEDVLTEVMDIFPSEYIHIGGDECPKLRWESCPKCQARIKELGLRSDEHFKAEEYLQSYVMNRVEAFLNAHGRRIIGWDEVLEGNVSQSATIMSWRGAAGGIKAAQSGRDAIMSPNSYIYLDYCQSRNMAGEPLCIGGYVPVTRVFEYEPYDEQMTPEECTHILGVQGNLWTEYIATPDHLEYMLLPRAAALSEVQWCMPERKDWNSFSAGMQHMRKVYDAMGVNYATHMFDGRLDAEKEGGDRMNHKAVGKQAVLNTKPHLNYTFHAPDELFDGRLGTTSFTSGAWIGWEGCPMDVAVKIGKKIQSVAVRALSAKGDWIFAPTWIKVYASSDGKEFTQIGQAEFEEETDESYDGIQEYVVEFEPQRVKYLKVQAGTVDKLPSWHTGAGGKAFLFVDEVIVR